MGSHVLGMEKTTCAQINCEKPKKTHQSHMSSSIGDVWKALVCTSTMRI